MTKQTNEWVIGYSCLGIEFEGSMEQCLSLYNLEERFEYNITEEDFTYQIEGRDVFVAFEEDKVSSVNVKDIIIYKGANLIGIKVAEFEDLVGMKYDKVGVVEDGDYVEYENGYCETCYDFNAISAMVWANESDIITAVGVFAIYDDDDMMIQVFP